MNSHPAIKAHQRGFTLIEMLTSMVVLAVMLVLAVPSLSSFVRSSKVRTAQSELIGSLMLARSEAAKRGVAVSVRANAPVSGNQFGPGWTVWRDTDANGAVDAGEEVFRNYASLGAAVSIKAMLGSTTTPVTLVTYAPSGFLTSSSFVKFTVCGESGATKGFVVDLQLVGLADLNDQATCP